ncbi:MAG: hypothetical protein IIC23_04075 [Chloroflexi bacterium]|nr:hypothetical protein [Chloroflexota bacterium]
MPTATPGAAVPPTFGGIMIVLLKIVVSDGSELPDGLTVIARIGDEYETEPVETKNGVAFIKIIPGVPGLVGRSVSVFVDTVPIDQELVYAPGTDLNRPVTIPHLPIPTPTPTKIPVRPAVYSGTVTIAGARVQPGMVLVARIGSYESFPANLEGPNFTGLVIITTDESLVGQPVEFYLNGIAATHSPGPFEPGKNQRLDLVFVGVPTPEPTATEPPATPTATAMPPTATATSLPPTATPRIITATPTKTPTATRIPPTNTPIIVLASPTPSLGVATVEPEESSGGCGSTRVPTGTAVLNMLLMMGPLAMIGGVKYRRRRMLKNQK